ncbi:MAG: ATP synthase subunit I [Myxococcota bacterium]|nr:ATP synthase subunit I [Myxococcota bacterium]
MTTDRGVFILIKRMIIIGFFLALGSLYFRSASVSFGVVAGVILAIANLWLIRTAVDGLLAGQRRSLTGAYLVKIVGVFGLLFFLIKGVGLNPLGIVAGWSVLVLVASTGAAVMTETSMDDSVASEGDE